ncbi:phosphoserine phosphatase SerB [Vibrio penaeicida]|uniref:Phosphoserine phosphatase n=1 Tax=Vibrio penaeicida TaxID=104609 RepID=A0AAV5NYQ2_9VIBR|nr:phosphoserine phosphatase SerB [Vibrio penaeicida]RTZ23711.1 phosphoserine phosphatase SerB [Vibrio penaeicida]GLQ75806.1 phosphoserine phosphatase SerB [Vibrio penaeicida]
MHVLTVVTKANNGHQWSSIFMVILTLCSQYRVRFKHVTWLSYEKAADFHVDINDQNAAFLVEQLRAKAESKGLEFDCVIQHKDARQKKLLVADMEATIIVQEMMDELASLNGVWSEVKTITENAMNGALDFQESFKSRVQLLEGIPVETMFSLCGEIKLSQGAKTLVRTLEANACRTVLITSGLSVFAQYVAEMCGFSAYYANHVNVRNGTLNGQVEGIIIDGREKAAIAAKCATTFQIESVDVCAVGDGANDKCMLKGSGLGVGHHPKPTLISDCDLIIQHTDLTTILYAMGLKETRFVRA